MTVELFQFVVSAIKSIWQRWQYDTLSLGREYYRGKDHCTVDLQLSYSWFQTSQTGGQLFSDTFPFSIHWLGCLLLAHFGGATTFSITTISITSISITTLSITIKNATLGITTHNDTLDIVIVMLSALNKPTMLSVIILNVVVPNVVRPFGAFSDVRGWIESKKISWSVFFNLRLFI
jgi:hypothetical protein